MGQRARNSPNLLRGEALALEYDLSEWESQEFSGKNGFKLIIHQRHCTRKALVSGWITKKQFRAVVYSDPSWDGAYGLRVAESGSKLLDGRFTAPFSFDLARSLATRCLILRTLRSRKQWLSDVSHPETPWIHQGDGIYRGDLHDEEWTTVVHEIEELGYCTCCGRHHKTGNYMSELWKRNELRNSEELAGS